MNALFAFTHTDVRSNGHNLVKHFLNKISDLSSAGEHLEKMAVFGAIFA